jgi:hypothetical protein
VPIDVLYYGKILPVEDGIIDVAYLQAVTIVMKCIECSAGLIFAKLVRPFRLYRRCHRCYEEIIDTHE